MTPKLIPVFGEWSRTGEIELFESMHILVMLWVALEGAKAPW